MSKDQITKNQHYIPQWKQNLFVKEDNYLSMYYNNNFKDRIPPETIFYEKYLYEDNNKNTLNVVEKTFASIEGNESGYFRKLIEKFNNSNFNDIVLTEQDNEEIMISLFCQIFRIKSIFNEFDLNKETAIKISKSIFGHKNIKENDTYIKMVYFLHKLAPVIYDMLNNSIMYVIKLKEEKFILDEIGANMLYVGDLLNSCKIFNIPLIIYPISEKFAVVIKMKPLRVYSNYSQYDDILFNLNYSKSIYKNRLFYNHKDSMIKINEKEIVSLMIYLSQSIEKNKIITSYFTEYMKECITNKEIKYYLEEYLNNKLYI